MMACASLIALAAAPGCGDDSGPGGDEASEAEIRGVLETVFTTSDPIQCEQTTQRAFEQLSPAVASAEDPSAECRKQLAPETEADSIEIADLSVEGGSATATVMPDGGAFAGAVVKVALVDEGGWKLDGFDDVEIEDREAFQAQLDEEAAGSFGNDAFTAGQSACIADFIRGEVSTEQIEESIASGSPTYVYDSVRACLGGGTDLIAIMTILRNQLVGSGVDAKEAECVAGAGIAGQKGATLEEFQASREIQERIVAAAEDGAQFCAGA